jgi:hypothetical protein
MEQRKMNFLKVKVVEDVDMDKEVGRKQGGTRPGEGVGQTNKLQVRAEDEDL